MIMNSLYVLVHIECVERRMSVVLAAVSGQRDDCRTDGGQEVVSETADLRLLQTDGGEDQIFSVL